MKAWGTGVASHRWVRLSLRLLDNREVVGNRQFSFALLSLGRVVCLLLDRIGDRTRCRYAGAPKFPFPYNHPQFPITN